jgi:tetratricopeptide (TPR) repeat protein
MFDKANLADRVLAYIVPYQADQGLPKELDKLQDVVKNFQRLSEANPESRLSHTEATLMQCAREVIVKGTSIYEASLAAESVARGQGAGNSKIRITEWVSALESIRQDQQRSDSPDIDSTIPSTFSRDEAHAIATSGTPAQHAVQESEAADAVADDSDDDLDTDLAKAALDTGTKAFEAQKWEEADSLLQEALRVLQQLPRQRRAFCDLFGLQYKLAVCAYQMQEPADAEEALMSLVQQSASSDEHRVYTYATAHLLSILYIRMGQVDRARSECEKALQGRRRLLGKRSDASLESTALMAHIYGLLNNRARATSCLAMIPEARRDAVVKVIEESLGTKVEQHPESSSLMTRSMSEDSDLAEKSIQSRLSASSLILPIQNPSYGPSPVTLAMHNPSYGRASAMIPQSPVASLQRQSHQRIPSNKAGSEDLKSATVPSLSSTEEKSEPRAAEKQSHQRISSNKAGLQDLKSATVTSLPSAEERSEPKATQRERANEDYSANPEVHVVAAPNPSAPPDANSTFKGKPLSRKDILDKIGCQPKDRIEEAVCEGDNSAFTSLLSKKKDFWRSKLRKHVRPERVTALHYAALFGEIDMARRLLSSNFNINEVPYGYTTSLTPLKFAIGARQVDMVEFLIGNGARPSEPDSWSTLAGQLMNRSWLLKTMSETEKEFVLSRMIAILGILLKRGWDVNAPFETSGRTVLHQAVAFWSGDYRWDLNLRAAVTSFLCKRGADPFQTNAEGKTPYDLASASGHQDLLLVLDRGSRKSELDNTLMGPVELSG